MISKELIRLGLISVIYFLLLLICSIAVKNERFDIASYTILLKVVIWILIIINYI
ncbi:hypothetical protein QJR26_04460 [Clostridium baratii]